MHVLCRRGDVKDEGLRRSGRILTAAARHDRDGGRARYQGSPDETVIAVYTAEPIFARRAWRPPVGRRGRRSYADQSVLHQGARLRRRETPPSNAGLKAANEGTRHVRYFDRWLTEANLADTSLEGERHYEITGKCPLRALRPSAQRRGVVQGGVVADLRRRRKWDSLPQSAECAKTRRKTRIPERAGWLL